MEINLKPLKLLVAGACLVGLSAVAYAEDAPFGGEADVNYAEKLWDVMEEHKLVGEDSIKVQPFEGNQPHGAIQEVLATEVTIDGHSGRLLVKRNHGGKEDLTVKEVYDQPEEFLQAVTIMFQREEGYDADNQDWFWAKYNKEGGLDKNPKGMLLAGRIAKGSSQGCIACHTALGGEDRETLTSQ